MDRIDTLTLVAGFAGAIGVTMLLLRRTIGRRFARGDGRPPLPCPQCGYDLRATLFFCPECGTELLWGQVPGRQEDYDAKAQQRERKMFQSRAGSR